MSAFSFPMNFDKIELMKKDFLRFGMGLYDLPNTIPTLLDQKFGYKSMTPWEADRLLYQDIYDPMGSLSEAVKDLSMNDIDMGLVTSDDEKFEVNLDVNHFLPDEIKVKVIDGKVVVKGVHEEKPDEHGFVSRQFVRKYDLPKECLPDTVESKLSSDGVLTIMAPKVLPMPSPGEKIVPIQYTGPINTKVEFTDDEESESE